MKQAKQKVAHHTIPLAEGVGRVEVFESPHDTDRAIGIASGFGAVPELYFKMADELAKLGYHVFVPDIVAPINGDDPEKTIEYKSRRIAMAFDALRMMYAVRCLELAGHSFGGVVVSESLPCLDTAVDRVHLISSLGFGGVINEGGGINVRQVPGFYMSEILGATRHLNHFLGLSALRAEIEVMADIPQRMREIRDMQALGTDYMVQRLGRSGVVEKVYVADRDHVIDPAPTLRVVPHAVRIHPRATHFAPTTHGAHVAHLIAA